MCWGSCRIYLKLTKGHFQRLDFQVLVLLIGKNSNVTRIIKFTSNAKYFFKKLRSKSIHTLANFLTLFLFCRFVIPRVWVINCSLSLGKRSSVVFFKSPGPNLLLAVLSWSVVATSSTLAEPASICNQINKQLPEYLKMTFTSYIFFW